MGRPTGRKVTVYMVPDVEEKAREIGQGNLSAGVAKAVRDLPEHKYWQRATDRNGAAKK